MPVFNHNAYQYKPSSLNQRCNITVYCSNLTFADLKPNSIHEQELNGVACSAEPRKEEEAEEGLKDAFDFE